MGAAIHEILDRISLKTVILQRIDLEAGVEMEQDPQLVSFLTGLQGDTWPAEELVRTLRTNPSFTALTAGMSPRETNQVFAKIKNWLIDEICAEIGANHVPDDHITKDADLQRIEEYTTGAVTDLFTGERRDRLTKTAPDTSAQSEPSLPRN